MTNPMMKLGLFLYGTGHHIASWRDPGVVPNANQSLRHYIDITQTAERALFDFVFNADSNSTFGPDDPEIWKRTTNAMRLEPLTLLGALSAVTSHIGLISTATTTYLDPFHVARMFATLDQMSQGRVGWNVVTSSAASEAFNFSRDKHAAHDDRYRRAAEFIEVAQGLWDTWEDDAFVMDKAQGLFFHPAKLHLLHHKGEHFSVRGPLMIPRSPQGQPVIVQAGQSDAGRELVLLSGIEPHYGWRHFADRGWNLGASRRPHKFHRRPGLARKRVGCRLADKWQQSGRR